MARVMVVDDEEGIRLFLSEVLEDDGHEVSRALDGRDAWRRLQHSAFHVVVTDLKMPRMDGMSLLRRLAEEQPEVEVIVLTAHGSVDDAVEAMKLGAFDFLQKPLRDPAELSMLVNRAVERHRLRAAHEARVEHDGPPLTWGAAAMAPVVDALQKVAPTDATVLLLGESGVGKEVAARALHQKSRRAAGPFIAVNCAALSEELLESELFGHDKGAFTGAHARRRGRIELAEGGTFFLDEVGELKPTLQAKLLRVLQERTFERVGGQQTLHADVRWVAATNRDLAQMVAAGTFRGDLFHRLALFPVRLPPLRERPEDLLPLTGVLLVRIGASLGRSNLHLSPEAAAAVTAHPWPGNVRELANALERAAILAGGPRLSPEHLVLGAVGSAPPPMAPRGLPITMAEAEEAAIRHALDHFEGNRRQAAEHLGIGLRTLYDKLKRYDLA